MAEIPSPDKFDHEPTVEPVYSNGSPAMRPVSVPRRIGMFREVAFSQYNRNVLDTEFLPELMGKAAIGTYREMRMNEPVVRGILFVIESLMRSREWQLEPVDDSPEGQAALKFCREVIDDMNRPLDGTIVDVQNSFVDGFSWSEIVYKVRRGQQRDTRFGSKYNDGKIGIRKIVGRSPAHLEDFITFPDSDDLKSAVFYLPPNAAPVELQLSGKSFHFRPSAYLDDPYGMSMLRGAYKPYWYKKGFEAFEAIAIERDMAGFITMIAPEGIDLWNDADETMVALHSKVQNFLMGVRINEIAGAAIPFGWEMKLLKGGGEKAIDIENVINRLEHRIGTVVAGDFILLGQEQVGSKSLAEVKWDTFCTAVMGYCKLFANEFRRQVLCSVMRANGMPEALTPMMIPSEVKQGEFGQFAAFVNALGQGGLQWHRDRSILKGVLDRAGLKSENLTHLANLPDPKAAASTAPADETSEEPSSRPSSPSEKEEP